MRLPVAATILLLLCGARAEPLAAQSRLPRSFGDVALGMPLATLQALQPTATRWCTDECLPGEDLLDLSLPELPATRAALLAAYWWPTTPPPADLPLDARLARGRLAELALSAPSPDIEAGVAWLVAQFGPWWEIRITGNRTGAVTWRDRETIVTLSFEVSGGATLGKATLPDIRTASVIGLAVTDRRADSLMTIAARQRGPTH